MRQWATENGITVDLQAETTTMLDHHRAKGNTMSDWPAAWRTWMRNSKRFQSTKPKNNGRRQAADFHQSPFPSHQAHLCLICDPNHTWPCPDPEDCGLSFEVACPQVRARLREVAKKT
jgi:hypothetical protein